jgi:hypothetical protein
MNGRYEYEPLKGTLADICAKKINSGRFTLHNKITGTFQLLKVTTAFADVIGMNIISLRLT